MFPNDTAFSPEGAELTNGILPPASSVGASLVVLDADAPSATLRAALQYPGVAEGELTLLVVFPVSEYEARRRARIEAGVTAPYTIDHLEMEARRIAQLAGREWLDPANVEFEAIGAVGRRRDCVRTAVEAQECSRVYLGKSRRTLWQRFLRIEDLSAVLTRTLPATVTVVSVDGVFDSLPNLGDGEPIPDLTADTDESVVK